MRTMKAARMHRFGGTDVLEIDEIEIPEPKENEILIRVAAASVNPVDYKIRSGAFPIVKANQLPFTLGRDVSGTVERTGTAVNGFKAKDEVYALLERDHGGYAEYTAASAGHCAAKPQTLDYVQAAAVPLAGLTAWQGLFDHGRLIGGQTVLIHGGAGGVGHFAIQFAKVHGAKVCTTVSTEDVELARDLGADVVVDYKKERFEDRVHDVDLVFDLVGGQTQDRSWSVLKRGGTLVSTLGTPPEDEARARGVRATGYMATPSGRQLSEIARLIDDGRVHPLVSATYSLDEVREAQRRAEQGHTKGKIVLAIAA